MEFRIMIALLTILLWGCANTNQSPAPDQHCVRDFCVATVCNSLENSGQHYQHGQQGLVVDSN